MLDTLSSGEAWTSSYLVDVREELHEGVQNLPLVRVKVPSLFFLGVTPSVTPFEWRPLSSLG